MLMLTNMTWLDICLASAGVWLVKRALTKKNPAPYPPGPPGWPLVGNIADMPHIKPWLTFAEWGKRYGDLSHIEILGQHIIVVNSVGTAIDMMDKKSTVYSDRPVFPMAGELVGLKHIMTLLPYGDHFRQQRKYFHRAIGSRTALDIYKPIEELETHRFLKRVLAKPDQLQAHVRHTAGAIILRISHGYEVNDSNDPFIDLAERVVNQFSQFTAPGAFMVDIIPSLAKVPEWFPGAGFKRIAREWHKIVEDSVDEPYEFVKDQMAAGIAPKSFTSNLLEGHDLSAEDEHVVKWSAASLYGGGADTTVSTIYSLFLAMTLFPDAQKKAQAEIDAVALAKEVLRWNAVVPTCVPHCVTEDDIHDGYYIPKGSLIIANVWFMLNDPRTYVNPSQFNPERFLASNGKEPETDPRMICFGFGRRICPGLHLADGSVVENGVEITPELDPSSGTISHPKPFKCSIKARSAKALELIQQDVNY
ncbi:cytochrome P450 [Suillus ampliporus]|nr:cytochrome P450 [Suillus ampliporus]